MAALDHRWNDIVAPVTDGDLEAVSLGPIRTFTLFERLDTRLMPLVGGLDDDEGDLPVAVGSNATRSASQAGLPNG